MLFNWLPYNLFETFHNASNKLTVLVPLTSKLGMSIDIRIDNWEMGFVSHCFIYTITSQQRKALNIIYTF